MFLTLLAERSDREWAEEGARRARRLVAHLDTLDELFSRATDDSAEIIISDPLVWTVADVHKLSASLARRAVPLETVLVHDLRENEYRVVQAFAEVPGDVQTVYGRYSRHSLRQGSSGTPYIGSVVIPLMRALGGVRFDGAGRFLIAACVLAPRRVTLARVASEACVSRRSARETLRRLGFNEFRQLCAAMRALQIGYWMSHWPDSGAAIAELCGLSDPKKMRALVAKVPHRPVGRGSPRSQFLDALAEFVERIRAARL
jgi:DNA-binding phage protein